MQNNTAIIPGSLGAIAKQNGQSIAETFVSCDVIAIVDCSGSMGAEDAPGGRKRYDAACAELASLQNNMPGKIGVIAFSDSAVFCPSGVPWNAGGGTNLAKALKFCKVADGMGIRFFLISDGEPNDPETALAVASTYKSRIDVIYIGPEDHPTGRDFLKRLAAVTGGQTITAEKTKELAGSITRLLLQP
jgi:Mg-chelatase subunit ChlD